jgi:hypothetical protein
MVTFLGYELELFDVQVIDDRESTSVRYGSDRIGGKWLIVGLLGDPDQLVWVCAPVSPRMLAEVQSGRANPWDAVRHSLSGLAEVVMLVGGRPVSDRCIRSCEVDQISLAHLREPVAVA